MAISLLGGVTVDDGSARLNPRDRAVLATLALHRGESVRPDLLADALWGDDPPASWAKNLHGCIVRLRKALACRVAGRDLTQAEWEQYVGSIPYEPTCP